MKIDVDMLRQAETGTSLPFNVSVPSLKLDDVPAMVNVTLEGNITNLEGIFKVDGTLSVQVSLTCGRCLEPYKETMTSVVGEEYARHPSDEQYPVQDDTIDLRPMLRNLVLLELPLQPLHDPDCRGLCSVCGRNLNQEPHDHPPEAIPGPFDALRSQRPRKRTGKSGKSS